MDAAKSSGKEAIPGQNAAPLQIAMNPFMAGKSSAMTVRTVQTALDELVQHIQAKAPIVLVVGNAGSGKSLLMDIAARFCLGMGMAVQRGDQANITFTDTLDVLFVDQAESMSNSILYHLLSMGGRNAATTKVFLCRPTGAYRFRLQDSHPPSVVELAPLTIADAQSHLQARANSIGRPDLFAAEAMDLLVHRSRGSLRLLRSIASDAILAAVAEGASQITAHHVLNALQPRGVGAPNELARNVEQTTIASTRVVVSSAPAELPGAAVEKARDPLQTDPRHEAPGPMKSQASWKLHRAAVARVCTQSLALFSLWWRSAAGMIRPMALRSADWFVALKPNLASLTHVADRSIAQCSFWGRSAASTVRPMMRRTADRFVALRPNLASPMRLAHKPMEQFSHWRRSVAGMVQPAASMAAAFAACYVFAAALLWALIIGTPGGERGISSSWIAQPKTIARTLTPSAPAVNTPAIRLVDAPVESVAQVLAQPPAPPAAEPAKTPKTVASHPRASRAKATARPAKKIVKKTVRKKAVVARTSNRRARAVKAAAQTPPRPSRDYAVPREKVGADPIKTVPVQNTVGDAATGR